MDFSVPQFLKDDLYAAIDQGFLGYALPDDELAEIFAAWLVREHGWQIDPEWVVWVPSIVAGLRQTAAAVCRPGDSIMMHAPIYYPFRGIPHANGCEALFPELIRNGDRWEMDFDLMQSMVRDDTRLFYLVNPQNPTCRVYSEQELLDVMAFCERNDLFVCVDEVHSLFILNEQLEHRCLAPLREDLMHKTISLYSPGKTYNISGNCCAAAVIPDPELRLKFRSGNANVKKPLHRLSIEAVKAAYSDTSDYVPSLLAYLRENADLVRTAIRDIPGLQMAEPDGTYNAFIDLAAYEVGDVTSHFQSHGIGLLNGANWGAPTFTRINYATPRHVLTEGLKRFKAGIEAL